MKTLTSSILCLTSGLSLSALCVPTLEAQTPQRRMADTLRRELTVHTDELVQLSERTALPLNLSVSPLEKSQTSTNPLTTTLPLGKGSSLAPLSGLSPLVGSFRPSPYRGYIHLAGGLDLHGIMRAGYRPIATDEEQLDIYGAGLYSRFTPYKDRFEAEDSKERLISLGTKYQRALANGLLAVGIDLKHHSYNYYGAAIDDPHYAASPPLNRELQKLLMQDKQSNNSLSAAISLTSLEDGHSPFNYTLSAKLHYTHSAQPELLAEPRASISEIYPELEARAAWSLSGSHAIGGKLKASTLLYGRSLSERLKLLYPDSNNKTIFDLTPYWQAKDLSWGDVNAEITAGLGLTNHTQLEGNSVFVWPYLNLLMSMHGVGTLRAELDGGADANPLSSIAEQMPYRTRGIIPEITRNRLRGRLSLTGELTPAMRMELYVGYARREQELNWGVQHHSILTPYRATTPPLYQVGLSPLEGLGIAAIEYAPYYTDTHQTTLGANFIYSYSNLWRTKIDLAFHKYNTSSSGIVSGRPTFVLDATYEYTPSKRFSLLAGYEISAGRSYLNLNNQTPLELDTLHLLKASVTYTISPRVSIQGSAFWMPNRESSLYYGYRMRQTTLSLGVNVNI